MKTVIRPLWLTALWVALWSDLSVANVLAGALVAGVICSSFRTWRPGTLVIRPFAAARLAVYFIRQLALSTATVARTVVTPGQRIHTAIVAVPLRGCSEAVATLIADAISLTPGTLTLEVRSDPLVLYVHALDVRDPAKLRRDIRRLEVLAVRAFGNAEALAGLAVDDTTTRSVR